MPHVWILKSLRSSEYEQVAFREGVVAIGWGVVGDLTLLTTESEMASVVQAAFPSTPREELRSRTDQLSRFRSGIAPGDLVVLLRRSGTDVAVGRVVGEYQYRRDLELGMCHVRPVLWKRADLPRSSITWLLLDMPTWQNIYCVEEKDSVIRLTELADSDIPFDLTGRNPLGAKTEELTPFANLKRNLEYARSLAEAGKHLARLDTRSFEVADMFRAAWVQGVAALDYWVRQETRERVLWIASRPEEPRPTKFSAFSIPLGDVEKILRVESSLLAVIDEQLTQTRGHLAYQTPDSIRDAFSLVDDVKGMWEKVASVLSGRSEDGNAVTSADVKQKLSAIVRRRNKIAHESDDDPDHSPEKRSIDAGAVTETIDWIERLAAAISAVLRHYPGSVG